MSQEPTVKENSSASVPPAPLLSQASVGQTPVYCVEERIRTIFVRSDVDPSQWDANMLEEVKSLFSPANFPQADRAAYTIFCGAETPTVFPGHLPIGAKDSAALLDKSVPDSERRNSKAAELSSSRISSTSTAMEGLNKAGVFSSTINTILIMDSQFSNYPVEYNGLWYPTSEHLFQSFKFQKHYPDVAEHIRICSERASVAVSESRRFQAKVRQDWRDINVQKMDETLYLKFTQHSDLRDELLATGNAELVENSDKDSFWGVGPDGRGLNELGKALERLRARLRHEI